MGPLNCGRLRLGAKPPARQPFLPLPGSRDRMGSILGTQCCDKDRQAEPQAGLPFFREASCPLSSPTTPWRFVIRPKTESARSLDGQDPAEGFKVLFKRLRVSKTSNTLFPEFFPTLHTPTAIALLLNWKSHTELKGKGISLVPVHSHLNPQTGCFARDRGLSKTPLQAPLDTVLF